MMQLFTLIQFHIQRVIDQKLNVLYKNLSKEEYYSFLENNKEVKAYNDLLCASTLNTGSLMGETPNFDYDSDENMFYSTIPEIFSIDDEGNVYNKTLQDLNTHRLNINNENWTPYNKVSEDIPYVLSQHFQISEPVDHAACASNGKYICFANGRYKYDKSTLYSGRVYFYTIAEDDGFALYRPRTKDFDNTNYLQTWMISYKNTTIRDLYGSACYNNNPAYDNENDSFTKNNNDTYKYNGEDYYIIYVSKDLYDFKFEKFTPIRNTINAISINTLKKEIQYYYCQYLIVYIW